MNPEETIAEGRTNLERRSWRIATSTVLLMMAGCGTSISDVPLNAPGRFMISRAPQAVEVFSTRRPSRPYVEVSMLEAQQASVYSTDSSENVMGKLREYAAKKGCDAIIIGGPNDATVGGGSVNNGVGSSYVTTLRGYRATCVVYTGAEANVGEAK